MSSRIGIINMALGFLGESPLTNLSEGNKLTRTATVYYDTARDAALNEHPWNFALKRAVLVQDSTPPDFEFTYRYRLPDDCLRVIYTEDDIVSREDGQRWPYKIEGGFLLTDLDEVKIKYIAKITEEGYFSANFSIAFACYLAYLMSMTLTEHRNQTTELFQLYKAKIADARFLESQEGTPDAPVNGGWISSRA